MNAPRRIEVEVGASEDAATTIARDQLMLLRCGVDQVARARVWRRRDAGLLLGRFHRADPDFCAIVDGDATAVASPNIGGASAPIEESRGASRGGLSRRLSGGRILPVGPAVVCLTMVVPVVDWLDPAGKSLRPDQVLNRAVRPLLAMLRKDGIDAFYPGRDLVTVAGKPIAHVSFTVMRDGLAAVEMHIAEDSAFNQLPALLDRFDPDGIAGVDRDALRDATSLAQTDTAARSDEEWVSRLASFAAQSYGCEAEEVGASVDVAAAESNAGATLASHRGGLTLAHSSVAHDFLTRPGPLVEGVRVAAAVSMLGVVEVAGRMRGDRLTGLEITGDLIAPFHTIDDISSECEGQPFRPDYIRKALARAMGRPRSFLLGLRNLDELILRLG